MPFEMPRVLDIIMAGWLVSIPAVWDDWGKGGVIPGYVSPK